jgi:hypothetical protein
VFQTGHYSARNAYSATAQPNVSVDLIPPRLRALHHGRRRWSSKSKDYVAFLQGDLGLRNWSVGPIRLSLEVLKPIARAPPQGARPMPTASSSLRSVVSLTVVMPVYNEENTVAQALRDVLSVTYPCAVEVIVVNDGSTDTTATILGDFSDPRLLVVTHDVNKGKGSALQTGIAMARGTHLLPFDSDLEYEPRDIPALLAPVLSGRASVVYGTRLLGANTVYHTLHYAWGNKVLTLVANVLFWSSISDLHTCFKLVPIKLLRGLDLSESGFGFDTELTAKILRGGHRPFEVPVSYYARSRLDGKKINWRDAVQCLVVLGRVRLSKHTSSTRASIATGGDDPVVMDLLQKRIPPSQEPERRSAKLHAEVELPCHNGITENGEYRMRTLRREERAASGT